jgi:hypothetical protein
MSNETEVQNLSLHTIIPLEDFKAILAACCKGKKSAESRFFWGLMREAQQTFRLFTTVWRPE